MLRAAAIVIAAWALPLGLAIWALATGRTLLGALFAAWCLVGSRRVMPLIRGALADRRR